MTILLNALAIRNYRGIRSDFQFAAPLKRFNFFMGPNNSGKSTFLNFASSYCPVVTSTRNQSAKVDKLDRNVFGGQVECLLGVPTEQVVRNIFAKLSSIPQQAKKPIEEICEAISKDSMIWLSSIEPFDGFNGLWPKVAVDDITPLLHPSVWSMTWNALTGSGGGSMKTHWIPETLNRIVHLVPINEVNARLIPAKRQISDSGEAFEDFSGRGLIDKLAELQSPDVGERENEVHFARINSFLESVTGENNAKIEIPHNRRHILVHMNGRVLPLSSLGTGIHEVILIASFCTITKNSLVCIEEPETHLHPIIQKKLIKYLESNTTNQYFIASHSNSLMQSANSSIFHVRLNEGFTSISPAITSSEKHEICQNLGFRATDILQANCVIWVEGPSDRIYVNHWISEVDSSLVEGVHYSVMFYGGRLLSHLSADDETVEDFISIRDLNRFSAIIIDSDRKKKGETINLTKQRINSEFSKSPGFCWVTDGKEIENYIPHSTLQEAVKENYGTLYDKPGKGGKYTNALAFYRTKPLKDGTFIQKNIDKVGVARRVCEKQADFNQLDLKAKVSKLVAFIKTAND